MSFSVAVTQLMEIRMFWVVVRWSIKVILKWSSLRMSVMAGLLSAAVVSLRSGSRALMRINTRAAAHQQVRERTRVFVCLYYIIRFYLFYDLSSFILVVWCSCFQTWCYISFDLITVILFICVFICILSDTCMICPRLHPSCILRRPDMNYVILLCDMYDIWMKC